MIVNHYGHLAPDYQDEAAMAIGRKYVSVAKTVDHKRERSKNAL
jgi:hypothetical protein